MFRDCLWGLDLGDPHGTPSSTTPSLAEAPSPLECQHLHLGVPPTTRFHVDSETFGVKAVLLVWKLSIGEKIP